MEAHKFATTVLENGILKIPELKVYTDQKVEVFVVIKPKKNNNLSKKTMDDFFAEWAGVFSIAQTDDVKYNYLMDKYK